MDRSYWKEDRNTMGNNHAEDGIRVENYKKDGTTSYRYSRKKIAGLAEWLGREHNIRCNNFSDVVDSAIDIIYFQMLDKGEIREFHTLEAEEYLERVLGIVIDTKNRNRNRVNNVHLDVRREVDRHNSISPEKAAEINKLAEEAERVYYQLEKDRILARAAMKVNEKPSEPCYRQNITKEEVDELVRIRLEKDQEQLKLLANMGRPR